MKEVGYAEAIDTNRPMPRKKAEPKLDHIRVTPAENGGHVVEHHFESGPEMRYKEPESHVFGKSEGSKLMAHLVEHLGIEDGSKKEEEKEKEE